mmetsp:Transcript_2749/g.8249  ORF Transcript_2749/g.8249 Transcript_2749/m.8249 type:complete len:254 (+) Transcript_2749:1133-1894(+)
MPPRRSSPRGGTPRRRKYSRSYGNDPRLAGLLKRAASPAPICKLSAGRSISPSTDGRRCPSLGRARTPPAPPCTRRASPSPWRIVSAALACGFWSSTAPLPRSSSPRCRAMPLGHTPQLARTTGRPQRTGASSTMPGRNPCRQPDPAARWPSACRAAGRPGGWRCARRPRGTGRGARRGSGRNRAGPARSGSTPAGNRPCPRAAGRSSNKSLGAGAARASAPRTMPGPIAGSRSAYRAPPRGNSFSRSTPWPC